jgi:hypothetical protein
MKWRGGQSTFQSAVDDGRGQADAGYLGLFAVMVMTMGAVLFMVIGLAVQQYSDPLHSFDALALGQGVGLAASGFAIAAGAVGAFKRLDQDPEHVSSRTVIETDNRPVVAPSAAQPVPVEIIAKEPVPVRESPVGG